MTSSIVPDEPRGPITAEPRQRDRWARSLVLRQLEQIAWGSVIVVEGNDRHTFGRADADTPRVTVRIQSPRFYSALAFRGSLGAAEAYMAGHWSADDLAGLIRIMVRNLAVLEDVEGGWARLLSPARRLWHWLRRNTKTGSRANIAAHYDLGNEFYRLFLDETLTYSCGFFERPDSTLAEASTAKYDRICRKLRLSSADHVVEIGSGWGGFALHAAGRYGCRVTTTTISQEQYDLAKQRVAAAGLEDRVELRLDDYRDLRGRYDKLVSIEMIEAVGAQYLDTFFRCCCDLLEPGGMMALQAITIADQFYARHLRSVDLIKRYIFPGSTLTSVTSLCASATRATDLRLVHLEDITPHYATTLRMWRERFLGRLDDVRAMGFPDSFSRMWEYYLAYCEGAFAERYIGDVQMVFAKPLCRAAPILATVP